MVALDDTEVLSRHEGDEDVRDAVDRVVRLGMSLAGLALRGCDLTAADFTAAHFTGANVEDTSDGMLTGTDTLADASLRNTDFGAVREDLWAVLSLAPQEVPAVRAALVEGRVDGGTYYGECACLIGTIAAARGCDVYSLESLRPTPSRAIEHFFLRINRGDTPQTNSLAKLVVQWIDEWRVRISP